MLVASFSQFKTLQSAFGWFVVDDLSHLGTYWSLPMLFDIVTTGFTDA